MASWDFDMDCDDVNVFPIDRLRSFFPSQRGVSGGASLVSYVVYDILFVGEIRR